MKRLRARETRALVALQGVLADRPGVLPCARGMSHFGEHSLGWLGLSGALVIADRRRRREWIAAGTAAFCAHAASVILKRIVRRPRPDSPEIRIGVGTPSKLSFPSSHATSTAAALVAASEIAGTRIPLLGIPVMMVSRMVLGVHFPTDTAAGALLGATTAKATLSLARRLGWLPVVPGEI
nr:phosphatase PAP2 family protein [Corynebacterium atypicum]